MAFDGIGALDGSITSIQLLDPDSTPNTVLDRNLPFSVNVAWEIHPKAPAMALGGDWVVRAFVESVGPGPEMQVGATVFVPVSTGLVTASGKSFTASVNVPANTLPANAPASGIYKLVVVVTHTNFGVKTEIAGFVEGPLFEVREP